MSQKISLFETPLWMSTLNIDTDLLTEDIYKFSKEKLSAKLSNIGGYQGHEFVDINLLNQIVQNIPLLQEKPLTKFRVYTWVNINGKGHRNERHCHINTNVFLSGVYYVKVPPSSGTVRFYDPRGHFIQEMTDYKYFYNGYAYHYIEPKENMILYFPSWLEHDVEESEIDDDRISIAFNITCDDLQIPTY